MLSSIKLNGKSIIRSAKKSQKYLYFVIYIGLPLYLGHLASLWYEMATAFKGLPHYLSYQYQYISISYHINTVSVIVGNPINTGVCVYIYIYIYIYTLCVCVCV